MTLLKNSTITVQWKNSILQKLQLCNTHTKKDPTILLPCQKLPHTFAVWLANGTWPLQLSS